MDGDKTYAELGIPGPAPCPPWCSGSHAGSHAGLRREVVIFYGASGIGGGVMVMVVNGEVITLGMNWAERFEDDSWQPPRDKDVTVFLQVGMEYIPVDATDRNVAGLAAIARVISPKVDDRLRQVLRLPWETRATWRPSPADIR